MSVTRQLDLPRLALVMLAGAVLGACSDSTGANTRSVSLSFTTRTTAPLLDVTGAATAPRSVSLTVGTHQLVIDTATVVLKHLKLDGTSATPCAESESETEGGSDDCAEVELGPLVANLPLDDAVQTATVLQVPAGTYESMNFLLHRLSGNSGADASFAQQHPELANRSVRVVGSYDGQPFVYTGTASQAVETEFSPPIVVDTDGMNVTLAVNPVDWFRDAQGNLIDPATANPGQPNEQLVTTNIKRSFRALHDDDRDAVEDE